MYPTDLISVVTLRNPSLAWTDDAEGELTLTGNYTPMGLRSLIITQRVMAHGNVPCTPNAPLSVPNTLTALTPTSASMPFRIPRLGSGVVGSAVLDGDTPHLLPLTIVTCVSAPIAADNKYDITRDILNALGVGGRRETEKVSTIDIICVCRTPLTVTAPLEITASVMPRGFIRIALRNHNNSEVNVTAVTLHPRSTTLAIAAPSMAPVVPIAPYGDGLQLVVIKHIPPHASSVVLQPRETYAALFSTTCPTPGTADKYAGSEFRSVLTVDYYLSGCSPARLMTFVKWKMNEVIGHDEVIGAIQPAVAVEALCSCAECGRSK